METIYPRHPQATPSYWDEESVSRFPQEVVMTRIDGKLLGTTIALVLFGLVSVFTASAAQALADSGNSFAIVIKQALAAVIGFFLLGWTVRVPFHRWQQWAYPIAVGAIILLGLTMVAGTTVNGSERWIALPFGFQFQPSDLAKISAIILLAQMVSQKRLLTPHLFVNLPLVGLMFLLIYQQPNLSVSLIIAALTGTMLFIGGLPLHFFAICIPIGSWVVYQKIMQTPYQKRRIDGWLDPWKDPMDTGYNLIQSYFAISGGGLFGVGLGESIQKLYYLPFQYTDFIFSVICEEWGFIGAMLVLGLFAMLGWRGFAIALNCPHRFGQMLAFGLTLGICLQALINICVTTGIFPVTGVTLPLISYGGTSMLLTLVMIGMLLNISRYRLTSALPQA